MRIRLVRKYANILNDVDLTNVRVGDVIDLKPHQAAMLIAEGWAEQVTDGPHPALRNKKSESAAKPDDDRQNH